MWLQPSYMNCVPSHSPLSTVCAMPALVEVENDSILHVQQQTDGLN